MSAAHALVCAPSIPPDTRILDTRDGTGGVSTPVGANASIQVTVAGAGGREDAQQGGEQESEEREQ